MEDTEEGQRRMDCQEVVNYYLRWVRLKPVDFDAAIADLVETPVRDTTVFL